jgi:arylsulfatase A
MSYLQLYDLSSDIAEITNLANQYPQVVFKLTQLMEKYVREGRSTP